MIARAGLWLRLPITFGERRFDFDLLSVYQTKRLIERTGLYRVFLRRLLSAGTLLALRKPQ
jgi:hypothetical protein